MEQLDSESAQQLKILRNSYEEKKASFLRFSHIIVEQIEHLLERNNIKPAVPIQTRIKTWASIDNKFKRLPNFLNETSKISEVYDLIGVRIILAFERDVEVVCNEALRHFLIRYENDKFVKLDYNQFGYRSRHFVVQLPNEWMNLPTLSEFADMQCEVQVRTVAQHLWAAASHELQYKSESSVPKPLRRSIHRISALLELIDEEFSRILEKRVDYLSEQDDLGTDADLNVDTLRKFLQGYLADRRDYYGRDFDYLRKELFKCNMKTIDQVKYLLDQTQAAVLEEEERLRTYLEQNEPNARSREDLSKSSQFSRVDWVLYALKISGKNSSLII